MEATKYDIINARQDIEMKVTTSKYDLIDYLMAIIGIQVFNTTLLLIVLLKK